MIHPNLGNGIPRVANEKHLSDCNNKKHSLLLIIQVAYFLLSFIILGRKF